MQSSQDAGKCRVPFVGARSCPVSDKVLQRLRHADLVRSAAGRLHGPRVLVQLVLVNTVELHGISHNIIADLLVFLDELGNVCKLLAVLDLSFEQLGLGWVSEATARTWFAT